MRHLLAACVVAVVASAPMAAADTLDEVTKNGMVVSFGGFDVNVAFTPDKRFTMMDGAVVGAWRIEGTRLCIVADADRVDNCMEFPAGKKSGDSFEVQGNAGLMTVKIK